MNLINIEFHIWLASKDKWVHLTKTIGMLAVPRVGEFIKFKNEKVGDYFAWKVSEVTYREPGTIEVATELLDNIKNRMYSFETGAEFKEYYDSYLAEGWVSESGVKPNTQYKSIQKRNLKKAQQKQSTRSLRSG